MSNIFEKAQQLNAESEMLSERAAFIDEQVQELVIFKKDLEKLEESANDKQEILANFGKGIYLKSQVSGKDLFVNVGAGVMIKKSISETKKVIDDQILKLGDMRERLNGRLLTLVSELNSVKLALEKEKGI